MCGPFLELSDLVCFSFYLTIESVRMGNSAVYTGLVISRAAKEDSIEEGYGKPLIES